MTLSVRSTRYPIDGRAERILAAAFTEFARRGVRAARLSVIARRAGVSLATLRQYFPSQDELFREVIRSAVVRRILASPEPGPETPAQPVAHRLRELMRRFWRSMAEPDQAALLRLSLGELSGFPELAVFHTSEVIGRTVSRVETLLGEGVRRGEIHLLDVRTAARVLTAALMTHALWFASPEVYAQLTGPDRDRAEQGVIDFFVRAIGGAVA